MQVGMATGEERRQMLCLRKKQWELELVAGDGTIPLAELVDFSQGHYGLNKTAISQLVDASLTANPRYTPTQTRREARKQATEVRYQALQKAYLKLKRRRPGRSDIWYSLQIAKMDIAGDLNPETIRKRMKK